MATEPALPPPTTATRRRVISTHASRRRGSLDAVADAADGGDQVGAELLAQVADVDVDDVGAGVEVVAPHVREQLLTRQGLTAVADQHLGERELARRQLDLAVPGIRPTAAQVETDVP